MMISSKSYASEIAILADPKIVLTLVQEEAAQTCRST